MRRMMMLAMVMAAASAAAGTRTPETSALFERHVVPESGVEFYRLRTGLVDESQQSLYFTTDAMTEDGRFLLFSAGKNEFAHPEIGKSPDARQLGYTLALVDFEKDAAVRLDIPRGIPFVDTKTDQLWYVRKNGNSYRGGAICRRDLKVDPHRDVVECRIPDEIFAGVRREHWITTHLTLAKNRRKAFVAFYMDDDRWEQGMVNFDTGRFESWGRTPFYANHDQLNPQDDSLALIAREECWERPDGRAFMNRHGWYPRLYLARPDGSRELVPSKIVNNATHERWTADGKGFYFCAPGPNGHSGVMYHDLATGDQTCLCPMRCMHPSLTADGRYVAWDDYQHTKKYFRGRAFQIGFWNRETRRGIWAQPMGVAVATLERQSNLHPDGHPTFVGGDRYLAWTYLNADGHMDVALAPTAPLIARTQKADPADKALFTGELASGVEAVPGDGSEDFHDVLVVGGTVEGVEKALALRQPTDFIPERVLVLTPFPYLGEDMAGTYELGFGEMAPTGGLKAAFWRGTTDHARFDYVEDPPCRHPQFVFRNDRHERLSEPRPPVRIGDTVCHNSDVDVRCELHEGKSVISSAEVIVLEGEHTHAGSGATASVVGTFEDGPRKGETVTFVRKPIELDLGLTDMKPFSYSAPIGSAVGAFKITLRKDPEKVCQFLSRVWFHLADAADTVHVPTPLKVKRTLDEALVGRGVDFMTSTAIDEVLRDKSGKIVGVRATNRSGTKTYRARRVIDATRHRLLERWGEPLAVGETETFSRIVMTTGAPPKAPGMKVERLPGEYPDRHTRATGRVYRCTFDLPMKDGTFASFAAAEWQARELTWAEGEMEDADLLTWHPKPGRKSGRGAAATDRAYDVVVVGGGTAGAPAAIAAARAGAKVLVVEYVGVLGGIGTDGMISGYYDGNHCGFTQEFTKRYGGLRNGFKHYARSETWRRMCREAGVTVWLGALGTGAVVEGGRVTGVVVGTEFGPQRVSAKCVIDATGNSDIAAAAGAQTEFIDAREFALQSDGQSAQRLARGGYNSDFGYVDDSSAEDLMRFMVRARAGAPNAWNIARMPDSRERRRIVSDYMLAGPDVAANRPFPDTVVQARSRQDAHGYVRDLFGYVAEDSVPELLKLSGRPRARYDVNVPLRSLLPKGLSGIAVIGLGAGVDRDVQPIIRMQADLMNMGYAVGTAAAMAARTAGGDFRSVDVAALKRTLVEKGGLRKEVLAWTADTDVTSDAVVRAAAKSLADDFRGSHVLWRKENRARALPLLREEYRKAATPKAQQIYAEMLGMLGDASGAEVLADIVSGKREAIATRHGRNYGEGNEGGDAPLGFMVALGRTKSPLALKPLLHALSEISVTSTVRPFRAVTLALEALGDPAAAPRLAAKLREPGMGGHHVADWRDLPPQGGYGGDPTIVKSIRELALARALLACGDWEGVGRKTYENYAKDARGVLSAHAKAVLAARPLSAAGPFGDWPEGKDPATMVRKVSDLFLTTEPDCYKPVGYASPSGYCAGGYGRSHIHYSVVSLWINLMDAAAQLGDAGRVKELARRFEPFYGPKKDKLMTVKHVDFNVVGAVPLAIARHTGDARARELGLWYAERQWEEPRTNDIVQLWGELLPFEERVDWWKKGYTDQSRLWIDDMYMITVLQSEACRLTGDAKYVDRAAREMCVYLDRLQIKDGSDAGLFHHGLDARFVWGRGAGWMAAGMPLLMSRLGEGHPCRKRIMDGYLKMMSALRARQNPNGMWNQLVGDRGSWEETSATAMFGYAFIMGVRHGWLSAAEYAEPARRAYLAIVDRMDRYGNVADVCAGTPKADNREHYLNRPRIHGDPHGEAAFVWMCNALLAPSRTTPGTVCGCGTGLNGHLP